MENRTKKPTRMDQIKMMGYGAVSLLLSAAQKEELLEKAEEAGISISKYIRGQLFGEANSNLESSFKL